VGYIRWRDSLIWRHMAHTRSRYLPEESEREAARSGASCAPGVAHLGCHRCRIVGGRTCDTAHWSALLAPAVKRRLEGENHLGMLTDFGCSAAKGTAPLSFGQYRGSSSPRDVVVGATAPGRLSLRGGRPRGPSHNHVARMVTGPYSVWRPACAVTRAWGMAARSSEISISYSDRCTGTPSGQCPSP
jgi:hypothetical protein